MNIAISSIITAPLSGWILSWSDWRMLFFVEGVFPFVIAAPLWFLLITDRPADAKWLSRSEREYIETGLARDEADAPPAAGLRTVFSSSVVWRLVVVYFLIQVGFYGLNLWLPHVVTTITGGSSTLVGFVTAIPYIFAIVGLYLNAHAADRNGRYAFHVMLPMAIAAVALVASILLGDIPWLSILLISFAMAGALAYDGPFWASASRAMPVALAGAAMGLINALGNLGGFVGPYVGGALQDLSGGSFLSTSIVLAVALLLAGVVMLTLRGRSNPARQPAETSAERGGP
ncbi:hypothetical protein GCM10023320_52280 [Pseudonocardia adelaidensis]|uniref:Major facilitator superfamily (MFS) profile domain-containing protein n=1 Tax=Pseudonocardia adelaidensis TaxID=648754 RepID=A0ABP9NQP1_9PSEU